MMLTHGLIVVPPIGFGVADLLARILDDARAFWDIRQRERAESVNRRLAQLHPFVDDPCFTRWRTSRALWRGWCLRFGDSSHGRRASGFRLGFLGGHRFWFA